MIVALSPPYEFAATALFGFVVWGVGIVLLNRDLDINVQLAIDFARKGDSWPFPSLLYNVRLLHMT